MSNHNKSCGGGLVMFKKSIAEANSTKEKRESARTEKRQTFSLDKDEGPMFNTDSGTKSKSRTHKVELPPRLKGRGRGQNRYSPQVPGLAHSDYSERSGSSSVRRSPLIRQDNHNFSEEDWDSPAHNAQPESINIEVNLETESNQEQKKYLETDSQRIKPNWPTIEKRPKVKGTGQEILLKTSKKQAEKECGFPHHGNEENIHPEKISDLPKKSEDGLAFGEIGSPATDHNPVLDKIHDMYIMYEENCQDDNESFMTNTKLQGLDHIDKQKGGEHSDKASEGDNAICNKETERMSRNRKHEQNQTYCTEKEIVQQRMQARRKTPMEFDNSNKHSDGGIHLNREAKQRDVQSWKNKQLEADHTNKKSGDEASFKKKDSQQRKVQYREEETLEVDHTKRKGDNCANDRKIKMRQKYWSLKNKPREIECTNKNFDDDCRKEVTHRKVQPYEKKPMESDHTIKKSDDGDKCRKKESEENVKYFEVTPLKSDCASKYSDVGAHYKRETIQRKIQSLEKTPMEINHTNMNSGTITHCGKEHSKAAEPIRRDYEYLSDTGSQNRRQRKTRSNLMLAKDVNGTSEFHVNDSNANNMPNVERLCGAVKSLSISKNGGIPNDHLVVQKNDQDNQSEASDYRDPEIICEQDLKHASSSKFLKLNDSDDCHQKQSINDFCNFGARAEVDIYSQDENESLLDVSHETQPDTQDGEIHSRPYPHHSHYPYYPHNQEVYNYHNFRAPNQYMHHTNAFHPQFSQPHTPFLNYTHHHMNNSQPLIIPSDKFGTRESIEMTVKYVEMQRQRWEEYAENCYGFCAPLDVIVCVRESRTWTRPVPLQLTHSNFHNMPMMNSAHWPSIHWQNPTWLEYYSRGSHGYHTATGNHDSECHGNSHHNTLNERAVNKDCVSLEKEALVAKEVTDTENHTVSTTADILDEDCARDGLSDDDSGSFYSTAHGEEINGNFDETQPKSDLNEIDSQKNIKIECREDTIVTMNRGQKDKLNEVPLDVTPFKKRKRLSHEDTRNSISNFLTPNHLDNHWKSSTSPTPSSASPTKRKHPLRNFGSYDTLQHASTPSSSSSWKKSKTLEQIHAYQLTGGKSLQQGQNSERDLGDDRRSTSEQSLSPKSTSGSIPFSPSFPECSVRQSRARTSLPPPVRHRDVNQNNDTRQEQKSRSRSLPEHEKRSPRPSSVPAISRVQTTPTSCSPLWQTQMSSSSRDSLVSISPCNHARRSFEYNDRWKVGFTNRSRAYNHTFIDTHCHIDFLYTRLSSAAIPFKEFMAKHSDSFPANYEGCVAVFCNPRTFYNYKSDGNDVLNMASREEGVWIAAGCHPKNAMDFKDKHVQGLLRILRECPNVVALGEIGLDYSGKFHQYADVQKQVFRRQLIIAVNMNLPLVIHCRDADEDCLQILQEIVPRHHKIHAHCFTRDLKMAHRWMSLFPNLYLGLTPVITYKSAIEAIETAAGIPLERLLLETDAPYFVPAGVHLCQSNDKYSHPGLALYTAETVARLKGIPVDSVLKACRANTHIVYGI